MKYDKKKEAEDDSSPTSFHRFQESFFSFIELQVSKHGLTNPQSSHHLLVRQHIA
jgi:hypothetical protein